MELQTERPPLPIKQFFLLDDSSDDSSEDHSGRDDAASQDTLSKRSSSIHSDEVMFGASTSGRCIVPSRALQPKQSETQSSQSSIDRVEDVHPSAGTAAVTGGTVLDTKNVPFQLNDPPLPGRQLVEDPPMSRGAVATATVLQVTSGKRMQSPPTASEQSPLHSISRTRLSRSLKSEEDQTEMPNILIPKWKAAQQRKAHSPRDPSLPSVYERGVRRQAQTREKIAQLRGALLTVEQQEATFHPQISSRARSLSRNHCDLLFDAEAVRLKQRMMLLELPPSPSKSRRSPACSARRCQSAGPSFMPAGERLYRDYYHRLQAAELAREQAWTTHCPPTAAMRTQKQIEQHINSLYQYRTKRLASLDFVCQEAAAAGDRCSLLVNPADVVRRLSRTQGKNGRTLVVMEDGPTFKPQLSPSVKEHVAKARERGYGRWIEHFMGRWDAILTPDILRRYTGPNKRVACCLERVLANSPYQSTGCDLHELLSLTEPLEKRHWPQLWREKPSADDGDHYSELCFAPRVNRRSRSLVEHQRKQTPSVWDGAPATNRLFHTAKQKQLQQRQNELEEQQAQLLLQEQMYERHTRQMKHWRLEQLTRAVNQSHAQSVGNIPLSKSRGSRANISRRHDWGKLTTIPPTRANSPQPSQPLAVCQRPKKTPVLKTKQKEQRQGQTWEQKPTPSSQPPPSNKLQCQQAEVPKGPRSSIEMQLAVHQLQTVLKNVQLSQRTPRPAQQVIPPYLARDPSHTAENPVPPEQTSTVELLCRHEERDLLLVCAACRDPNTVTATQRNQIAVENRRRLRALANALYRRTSPPH